MKQQHRSMLSTLTAILAFTVIGCGSTINPVPKIGLQGAPNDSPGAGLVMRWEEEDPASRHKSAEAESERENVARRSTVSKDPVNEDLVGTATTLREGDPAPFTGTLLDPEATAKIAVELESGQRRTDMEVRHATKMQELEYELRLKQEQIELDAERERRKLQTRIRDEQIEDLNKQLAKEKDDMVWLWFAAGGAVGTGLTVLGVFLGAQ